jgi:GTP-binding protein Era
MADDVDTVDAVGFVETFVAGFVAIVGRPNTGKSTLVNALMDEKISIVTSKPQTTRQSILGILTNPTSQVVLVDTPGMHSGPGKLMHRAMNRSAMASLAGAELIVFVVEATGWRKGDDYVLERLRDEKIPVILVVNKMDLLKRRDDLLPLIEAYSARGAFAEVVPISARRGNNLDRLLDVILSYLPKSEPLFPKDTRTDRSMEFRVGEMLREKLLETLREEVPYGLAVEVRQLAASDARADRSRQGDLHRSEAYAIDARSSTSASTTQGRGKLRSLAWRCSEPRSVCPRSGRLRYPTRHR